MANIGLRFETSLHHSLMHTIQNTHGSVSSFHIEKNPHLWKKSEKNLKMQNFIMWIFVDLTHEIDLYLYHIDTYKLIFPILKWDDAWWKIRWFLHNYIRKKNVTFFISVLLKCLNLNMSTKVIEVHRDITFCQKWRCSYKQFLRNEKTVSHFFTSFSHPIASNFFPNSVTEIFS